MKPPPPRVAIRVALRLARHVTREVARPLGARLASAVLLALLLVVQFATVIPWATIESALATDPRRAAALGVGLLAANQLGWASPLRALLVDRPALAPWWRSGLPPLVRAVAIAPALVALALLPLAATILWPAPLPTLAWRAALAVLFGALAAGGATGIAALVVATCVAFAVEAGARATGLTALLPLVGLGAAALAGPLHARWTTARPLPGASWTHGLLCHRRPSSGTLSPQRRASSPVRLPWPPGLLRPRGPLGALVWRDLVALARTAPDVPRGAVLVALPLGALVAGLRHNGGLAPAALTGVMAVAACVVAPLGGVALARVRVALGPAFFVRRWAPGVRMRIASLFLVALATSLPSGVALAAAAPGVGPTGLGVMGLAAAACAAGAVLLAVRARFDHGWHLWWVFGVLLLCVWDTAAARLLQALAASVALTLATRRLGRA